MPIISAAIAVSTTPVKLLDERRGRRFVCFTNETGGHIHVGGPTMTADDGMVVENHSQFLIQQQHENDFTPSHEWWGRLDAGSGDVIVTYATEDSTD